MQSLQSSIASALWSYFSIICSIPHPSKHEDKISNWILTWAKEKRIHCVQDHAGNLILNKSASSEYEHNTPVILQAHLDMVPQKNNDVEHDFQTDAIQTEIKGDWLHAKNTTLGADNGIGMASCLAVLADNTLKHGPLEVLLTTCEEAGMIGAFGLKTGALKGKILLNTDSEDEGELYVGCAGGININSSISFDMMAIDSTHIAFQISLTGLKGGHSGCDIHLGRANAIKVIASTLINIDTIPFSLVNIQGGSLRNAIPREASAKIVCRKKDKKNLEELIDNLNIELINQFSNSEENLSLTITSINLPKYVLTNSSQKNILTCLNECQNGIYSMDNNFTDVVQTSSNLGVLTQDNETKEFKIKVLLRSQVAVEKDNMSTTIRAHFEKFNAKVILDGEYPGWEPNMDSAIYKVMEAQYKKLFNKTPKTMVIHAGLECGLFSKKYPEWDMISFGPTIMFPHSPDEKVNISTVDKFWQLLIATLAAIE
ncbi:MAG: aminoacyl-histidine dipeptidase [Psychromonas sp.]|nr:aminoacyl-histidine dipeptidase [Psychromonas sp.]